ncbi:polyprenyl synthetase family protein [Gordonia amicalis]|uniref:polyprenyl synthetase family protein n=1 Tax=Gordonia amicalis TaxID=89053 RepID=UPI000586CD7B|nr:polyprenyl synthetase family protein [Gordonia amicalis]MBA5848111.1 polyprenyl synthetase family protein [Gordonia amicalis]MCZ0915151.1 polyprenyl synthetase family protein [Gordonia amicalis]MDV7100750.1 polyprenyl synthetase family protein [Gordonia amicalis]MDV7172574.1 polyprenyl synthetase family protein [Gordonia amicalis]NKX76161.1 polyprenyl synthetase family protein [Gordonia amicalis]
MTQTAEMTDSSLPHRPVLDTNSGLRAIDDATTDLELVEEVLAAHFRRHALTLQKVGAELTPAVDAIGGRIGGGKRLRAAFCLWGARGAARGQTVPGVVELASAIELFHFAALVHDDVMDDSDTRRGLPTVHRHFADTHRADGRRGDSDTWGTAVAILVGDMCLSWSDDLVAAAVDAVPRDVRQAVRETWTEMRNEAYAGQYLDMLGQTEEHTDPDRTVRVLRYKSARYSIGQPLRLGGTLAGADAGLLADYDRIGLSAGEAFQLRDDILGVFGDEKVTGKPTIDDIREGKRTMLMALAEESATWTERRVMANCLGNPDLDADGAALMREVVESTGALERVEQRIVELAEDALAVVAHASVDDQTRQALTSLVERCVWRRS